MNDRQLRARMAQYKFYHIIKLKDGLSTPGDRRHVSTQQMALAALRGLDLKGKRVLDIGCRDGLFSFEAEKMGSAEVIGIDNDLSKPAVEFLIPYFGSSVKMVEMNLFDLTPASFGLFDVVIFAGVLYHLRYPFWALKLIRDVMNPDGTLLVETAVWRGSRRYAMLYCPVGMESPYEPTSCTFFNEKGLVDSLHSLGFDVDSIRTLSAGLDPASLIRRSKRIVRSLQKRVRGFRTKAGIDRAVLVCHLAPGVRDEGVTTYWDGLHNIHTTRG